MTASFHDKSVIVTGAASGIGRATARHFAFSGAKVLAVDVQANVHAVAADHENISSFVADVGTEQGVLAMIAAAAERNGSVDVLCANAGVSGGTAGLFEQEAADWAAILQVNLIGPFLAIKHGARAMLNAGRPGSIVCTASVAGLRAGAGGPAYSASKAGVINLVQIAAQQLAGSGIRVNAVCPGLTRTGMTRLVYEAAQERGRSDRIGQLNPLKRGGTPEELAEAILFLASDRASYINGHALVVDGGLSTSHPFARPKGLGETSF